MTRHSLAAFVFWTVVFAVSYCQAPLYFSNQNQYFVHGMAQAGFGHLDEDWLANTKDPTPIFSFLVGLTGRFLHPNAFYLYYALLMGVYFVSMLGLFDVLAGSRATPLLRVTFAACLLLIHSAALRAGSARLLGVDYPWYFQAGLAGQYLLGPMFQPSTFGVLLIVSLLAFARGRPFLAVTCSSLAAVLHATYLPSAAIFTLAYMLVFGWEREYRKALLIGTWALLLVLPAVVYNLLTFRPSSAEAFAAAQHILVHFRLPHHSVPRLWFDGIAFLQVAWLLLGALLARGTRLFPVLLIAVAVSAVVTIVQIITDHATLALLFPWRISVILVPAATAIIVTRLLLWVSQCAPSSWRRAAWAVNLAVIVLLMAAGLLIMNFGLAFHSRDEELPLLNHVRQHAAKGDVYLLPVEVRKATTRGAYKSDFVPLTSLRDNDRYIPLDLQRFRLLTGAPIFVDFKSIPYQDSEMLEWHRRLLQAATFGKHIAANQLADIAAELREQGITHIVTRADVLLDPNFVDEVHKDQHYRVYRLRTPPAFS